MSRKQLGLFLLILIFGFILRIPQLNFPSIGYHNMKENNFISAAKNMMHNANFIDRTLYYKSAISDKKNFENYPQIPFVAYQIILGHKLFGENLWFPRLINVFLMILSIIIVFHLTYIFTKNYTYSLISVILLSILPLGVYFSRNLQPEPGAFLFMCLGNLLFIKFIKNFRERYLYAFGFCFAITAAYKLTFLIGFVPLLLFFPYRRYILERKTKRLLAEVLIFISPFVFLLIYWIKTEQFSFSAVEGRLDIFNVFSISYWRQYGNILWYYIKNENFTTTYFLLFIAGLVKVWLNYKKDRSLFANYLRAWSLTIIFYLMICSEFLTHHNYYQMPFLGFVCLTIVYFIKEISCYLSKFLKKNRQEEIFVCIFCLSLILSFVSLKKAIISPFNVIFPGTDVVGKLLKDITGPGDRFFIYTHVQGYAPCIYAERKCDWPDSLEDFKAKEEKLGVRHVVVYPLSFLNKMPSDIKDYIQKAYRVKVMGFIKHKSAIAPIIILLEKGGQVNIAHFLDKNKNRLHLQKVYHMIRGKVPFYVMTD